MTSSKLMNIFKVKTNYKLKKCVSRCRLCFLRETHWKKKYCSHPLIHFSSLRRQGSVFNINKIIPQSVWGNKRREMPDAVINWYYTLMREWDWHKIIFKTREDVSCLSPSSTSFVQLSPSCNSQPIRASWETLSVCQPPKAFQKSPRTDSVNTMCASVCESYCYQLLSNLTNLAQDP